MTIVVKKEIKNKVKNVKKCLFRTVQFQTLQCDANQINHYNKMAMHNTTTKQK